MILKYVLRRYEEGYYELTNSSVNLIERIIYFIPKTTPRIINDINRLLVKSDPFDDWLTERIISFVSYDIDRSISINSIDFTDVSRLSFINITNRTRIISLLFPNQFDDLA